MSLLPTQSGLGRAGQSGLAEFGLFGVILECVVVDRHFPGQKGYELTNEVLYDLDPLDANLSRIYGAPSRLEYRSYKDGAETLLRPMSKSIISPTQPINNRTPRADTDGDVVLVQFLHGSRNRPIITHSVTHKHSAWPQQIPESQFASIAQYAYIGQRRSFRNGTLVTETATGDIEVQLNDGDSPKAPGEQKSILIASNNVVLLRIKQGQIEFFPTNDISHPLKAVHRVDDKSKSTATEDANWWAFVTKLVNALVLLGNTASDLGTNPTFVGALATAATALAAAGNSAAPAQALAAATALKAAGTALQALATPPDSITSKAIEGTAKVSST